MAVSTAAAAKATATIVTKNLSAIRTLLGLYAIYNPYNACLTNNTSWDHIVVGGGTAGCVLANRLSEDNKVLLIEAGGDFDMQSAYPSLLPYIGPNLSWNYKTQPDENLAKCHLSAEFDLTVGKVLGGDSSVDFMIYTQGEDRDYNKWAKMTGEPAWSYQNVLRLFKKLERFDDKAIENSPDREYHGFEGNVGISKDHADILDKYMKAFEQIGKEIVRDINNRTKTGVTEATRDLDNSIRQNTALAYLNSIKTRPNLSVLKDTIVTKILIDGNNKAEGVLCVTKDNRTFVFKAKDVIVSAGPFNTAKLLQLSGIGEKKLLNSLGIPVKSDLPVGKNYQDHLGVPLVIGADRTKLPYIRENFNYSAFPAPSIWNFDSLNKSNPYPECLDVVYVIKTTPPSQILTYTSKPLFQYSDKIVNGWFKALKGWEVLYAIIQTAKMDSRGEVRARSTNPSDPPIIDAGYLSKSSDVENLIKCSKEFLKILDSPMLKKSGAFLVDPTNGMCGSVGSDEFWSCYVKCLFDPQNHHIGTAALGSVVDGRMFVKGVEGLRVADASVFPELMTGSMLGPTIMLGEMVAEMVKEEKNRNN